MPKLLAALFAKFAGGVGKSGIAIAVCIAAACVLGLLWQNGRSSLKALREEHLALQHDYSVLQSSLERCRESARLGNSLLVRRENDAVAISNKYKALRDELLHGLLAKENDNAKRKAGNAPESLPDGAPGALEEDLQGWGSRPVPERVRRLLANQP